MPDPYRDQKGVTRHLGVKFSDPEDFVRSKAAGYVLANYVDRVLPRDDIEPVDLSHLVRRTKDQDGYGACAYYAMTGGKEAVEYGANPEGTLGPLNALQGYRRVCGGYDRGSSLSECLEAARKVGTVPESIIPEADGWYPSRWPSGWEAHAAKHQVKEYVWTPTFEDICTALQVLRKPCPYAILLGDNFKYGSDGWIADRRGGGGGHGMLGIGVVRKGNRIGILTLNSWGTDWGIPWKWGHLSGGICIVPESYFTGYYQDSWCVLSTTVTV